MYVLWSIINCVVCICSEFGSEDLSFHDDTPEPFSLYGYN